MKKLVGAIALLLLVGGTGTGAQAGSWCAYYDFSTYNCGFHSFQQCLATVRGAGGMVSAELLSWGMAAERQKALVNVSRHTRA